MQIQPPDKERGKTSQKFEAVEFNFNKVISIKTDRTLGRQL